RLLRCGPAITRSIASSNSDIPSRFFPRRAVRSAASFTMLARSAPLNPGVLRASTSRLASSPIGLPRTCTPRIARRPFVSGLSTTIRRSNRPGRSSAGSRMSARSHADEHFHKLAPGDREERDPGLAGDRLRQQRLAASRRSYQEHAPRDLRPQRLELLGVPEELDDLLQLLLRFVDPRDAVEGHAGF